MQSQGVWVNPSRRLSSRSESFLAFAALQTEGTFQLTAPIAVTRQACIDRESLSAIVAWNGGIRAARKLQVAILAVRNVHIWLSRDVGKQLGCQGCCADHPL